MDDQTVPKTKSVFWHFPNCFLRFCICPRYVFNQLYYSFLFFRVFLLQIQDDTKQTAHNWHNTLHQSAHNTHNTPHHSTPLPTNSNVSCSWRFMILLIAQDFDASFGRDGVPFRPAHRGPRRFSRDVRCQHSFGKLSDTFVGHVHVRHLVPMWSGWRLLSTLICLLSHLSAVTQLPGRAKSGKTLAKARFDIDGRKTSRTISQVVRLRSFPQHCWSSAASSGWANVWKNRQRVALDLFSNFKCVNLLCKW